MRFFEQRLKNTSGKSIFLLIMIINRLKIGMEEKLKQAENMDDLQKTVMYGNQMLMPRILIHRIGIFNIRVEQYHTVYPISSNTQCSTK